MQVILHTGAHFTDEDRILKCLLKNRGELAKLGTSVPPRGRYRRLVRDSMQALAHSEPSADARDILLEAILEEEQADRLILSNEHFFSVPRFALMNGQFYTRAVQKIEEFRALFAQDEVEICMALRNPATFLPALFADSDIEHFTDFTDGTEPNQLRWSELIRRIRVNLPDVPLTIWCNEDTPLIWGQIIREMAALHPNQMILGGYDLLGQIMTPEGMKRFRAYLKSHPNMTEVQKRRVMAAFLDKFALDDEIEEELDIPGWTDDLIDHLTELYDEDVFEIQRMPGVNFISP